MKRRDFVRHTAVAGAGLVVKPALSDLMLQRRLPMSLRQDFNPGWRFLLADAAGAPDPAFDDGGWATATLPHTARIEHVVTGPPGADTAQWQGICWYRKRFSLDAEARGWKVFLKFEAGMNVADVWVNGIHLGRHLGGWLPFGFDISDSVVAGGENIVAVRLDNRDDPVTGPKPLAQLDFNWYHGLYRNVHLIIKEPLHITDPIIADKPAGGGVFVTYPEVNAEAATVRVRTHVRNDGAATRSFSLRQSMLDGEGRGAVEAWSDAVSLRSGEDREVTQDLRVAAPQLWSPGRPNLYTLVTEVAADGVVVDRESTRIGIRHLDISADGFHLNGQRMFLRGTNRHQEYPYVGYALSDAAQHRDARKIKDAGFDLVRLSHYAHAPAFMDACDELGLVVMNCIPGWQFFNPDPAFAEVQYANCRALVRRDRNHACVALWEVSLNETAMPPGFISKTHTIAHEEYPGDQCYTCGWTDGYDVFIQARQHGGCTKITGRACMVSEYGDWEYYSQNAGLHQEARANLTPDDANSRQMRWNGEAGLLQQATNFQEAHNDDLGTIAFADGLWVMFDYNRGYAPDIESSGCMDLFRIPKLSHRFFQSQRSADERLTDVTSGPMVFIASFWTGDSPTDVRVFSNCQEVELRRDGRTVGRRTPDAGRMCTHLAHPPFTFHVGAFRPGSLEAVGYIGGRVVARHAVRTPGTVARLELTLDEDGHPFAADGKDVAFLRATLTDARGTTVSDGWENVFLGSTGDIALVGANPFSSEAGIASILVQSEVRGARGAVYGLAIVRDGDRVRVLSAARSVGGDVQPWQVRVTTDGSEPGPEAPLYAEPFVESGRVRASLRVDGSPVVAADTAVPKFRIPGSKAPVRPG